MTIPTQYDNQNIIAMIIRGEIPNHTVYEDDQVLAFMDIMPQADGHLLIVTKASAISLLDVKPEDLSYLIKKVQTIAQTMEKYFNADGILLRQFNGEASGQTIFHLHFHLIPVKEDTKLKGHGIETVDADILAQQAADLKQLLAK